jgi:hypothetical protein
MLDRYNLPASTPALIAPGTIYRLNTTSALRILVLPERARPLSMAALEKPEHHEIRMFAHAE